MIVGKNRFLLAVVPRHMTFSISGFRTVAVSVKGSFSIWDQNPPKTCASGPSVTVAGVSADGCKVCDAVMVNKEPSLVLDLVWGSVIPLPPLKALCSLSPGRPQALPRVSALMFGVASLDTRLCYTDVCICFATSLGHPVSTGGGACRCFIWYLIPGSREALH